MSIRDTTKWCTPSWVVSRPPRPIQAALLGRSAMDRPHTAGAHKSITARQSRREPADPIPAVVAKLVGHRPGSASVPSLGLIGLWKRPGLTNTIRWWTTGGAAALLVLVAVLPNATASQETTSPTAGQTPAQRRPRLQRPARCRPPRQARCRPARCRRQGQALGLSPCRRSSALVVPTHGEPSQELGSRSAAPRSNHRADMRARFCVKAPAQVAKLSLDLKLRFSSPSHFRAYLTS